MNEGEYMSVAQCRLTIAQKGQWTKNVTITIHDTNRHLGTTLTKIENY